MTNGIAKRLQEAIAKMETGDVEGALIPVSIAVASTAQYLYRNPKQKSNRGDDGLHYKRFVHDNLDIITRVAFAGLGIDKDWFIKYNHPDVKPDSTGHCTIEQILYHVIRCGLVHRSEIPSDIRFAKTGAFPYDGKPGVLLPEGLIYGLIIAVVVVSDNVPPTLTASFTFRGKSIPLIALAGQRARLESIIQVGGTITRNYGVIVLHPGENKGDAGRE
jgi:hypothetical protein